MLLDNCPSLSVIATPSTSVHGVSMARWWCYGGCRVVFVRGVSCPMLAPASSRCLKPVSASSSQLQLVPAGSSQLQPVPAGSS